MKLLLEIKKVLLSGISEYCDTIEAAAIIGVKNTRMLKRLNEMEVLPRYKRENKRYLYKKSDCKIVADLLDKQQIVL